MIDFLEQTYKNIKGITVIDSGKPGKNIGIIAVTHGNEPVGMKIFQYLLEEVKISENIKSGKIFLIVNNIQAYKKYLASGDINNFRFIDDNMNRISNQETKPGSYEFQRLDELRPIFDELDVIIDIHSVSKGNELIGLTDTKYLESARKFFDVDTILVDDMGNTGAVIGELLRKGKEGYGLECGNHIDASGFENGKRNIYNFLIYFGILGGEIFQERLNPNTFEFMDEIRVQTENFVFARDFRGFTPLKIDEVFARDGNLELKNTFGEDIYIGIVAKQPKLGDGAGFLFRKL